MKLCTMPRILPRTHVLVGFMICLGPTALLMEGLSSARELQCHDQSSQTREQLEALVSGLSQEEAPGPMCRHLLGSWREREA